MTSLQHWNAAWVFRAFVFLSAIAATLWIEWARPAPASQIDESMRDAVLRIFADEAHENRIAIIDINEASIAAEGAWPWPRAKIAALIETLIERYNAKAVGIDIVFPEVADAEGDARLAALALHGPVVLSQIFDYAVRVHKLNQGVPAGDALPLPGHVPVRATGFISNNSELSAAQCVGNIGYIPDNDGSIRRIPLATQFDERNYLHLSYALLRCAGRQPAGVVTDQNGFWRVPFTKSLSAYTVIPAHEVLAETASHATLDGRYIIIGSSSLSLGDRVSTPLAPLSSGMLVHASSLSAMLDLEEGKIKPVWSGRPLLIFWVLSSFGIASLVVLRGSAWGNALCLFSLLIAWFAFSAWGVVHQGAWSIVAPMVGYLLLFGLGVPHEWRRLQVREKWLMETFSHYVAKSVLDELLRSNFSHSLEPQLLDVTVLVADMENYTTTISALPLRDAAALTKAFLDRLTHPVLESDGTLDKYTGDGLVAFWGAPLPCPEQADRAVDAAERMLAMVESLNAERAMQGAAPLRVRIGIESGTALVGDLGTNFRSTYTAVGDCINFASRLQEAARDLASDIVIGPQAKALLMRHATASMGNITLRGVNRPIEVFRISSLANQTP